MKRFYNILLQGIFSSFRMLNQSKVGKYLILLACIPIFQSPQISGAGNCPYNAAQPSAPKASLQSWKLACWGYIFLPEAEKIPILWSLC